MCTKLPLDDLDTYVKTMLHRNAQQQAFVALSCLGPGLLSVKGNHACFSTRTERHYGCTYTCRHIDKLTEPLILMFCNDVDI